MSNEQQPEVIIRVNFTEKRSTASKYENATAGIEIEQRLYGELDPDEVVEQGQAMFQQAKVLVYEELGVQYKQDDETGIISAISGAQTVTKTEKAPATKASSSRRGNKSESNSTRSKPANRSARTPKAKAKSDDDNNSPLSEASEPDLWEDLITNPDDWEDQSESKTKDTQPDFVHKREKKGRFNVGLWSNSRWVEGDSEEAANVRAWLDGEDIESIYP